MPPCIQLETKWSMEYGMPSTHSMVGLAVPTSILYYTATRYQVIITESIKAEISPPICDEY